MTNSLKSYLLQYLGQKVQENKEEIKNLITENDFIKEELLQLESNDLQETQYHIFLRSMWEKEGEENLDMKFTGDLQSCIQLAEKVFQRINKRSGVCAFYRVRICLGEFEYPIPEEFFKKD